MKNFNKIKSNIPLISVIGLAFLGFIYRLLGLSSNYSFWTDEDHVAIFARAILLKGRPILENGYSTGTYQFFQYWLTALSMKIFGINEFAARFPTVIIGSLTIIAIYFLGTKIFNKKVGLISSIFTAFLNIEILWSRQCRPYQAIQLFYVLEIIMFTNILEKVDSNKKYLKETIILLALISVSSLFHWFGLLMIIFLSLYLLVIRFDLIKLFFSSFSKRVKNNPIKIVIISLVAVLAAFSFLWKLGFFFAISHFVAPSFNKITIYNHVGYYHSFLWRQYGLIIFLFLSGLSISLLKNFKKSMLFLIIFIINLGYISFRIRVPFSRYVYPIFPIIIIFSAYGLTLLGDLISENLPKKLKIFKEILPILLAIFLVINGYKFSVKPKYIYSLNADMQEIPEVDFKRMYSYINQMTKGIKGWVLISTWTDHATWYLGEGKPDYWLRQEVVLDEGNTDILSGAKAIENIDLLKKTIKENKKGIVVLESWETFIPEGTSEYIKKDLKKEAEFDRIYPVQSRYWPIEVYSWGF